MTTRIPLFAGASLLALMSAAGAQEATGALLLGEITVEADALAATAPVDGYMAETSQSATKTDTPILETPQSISVVTTDQIRDQGSQTVGQALGFTSGVIAEPYGADPRFDSPTLRGFDARNSQYLNGLRLMRSPGAPSYDLYGLERVEVLKGPSSVLYGAGSPAGIIDMVQKHAQPESFGEVGASYGTHGNMDGFFDLNRAASDTFSYRLTGIARKTEDDIEDITNERGHISAAARWDLAPATTLDLLASYQKDSPITPAGVPFGLTGQGNDDDLREFYIGDPSVDDSDRRMGNIGLEFSHEFASGWTLEQNLRYQKFDWDYTGFYVGGLTGDEIGRGVVWQDEDTATANADTRVGGNVMTGPVEHQLLLGADLRHYSDETTTEFGTSTPVVYGDPATYPAAIGDPWYVATDNLTLDQIGIYAQDELAVGRWRGTLGLRHDWTDQEGTIYTNFAGTSPVDQKDEATTGRAGLSYVLDSGLAPYVSYATSFDPEIGADIAGNQLEPTEGRQWEAGLKYQPAGYDALITAAVYDLEQSNVSTTVTEGGITGTRQIGKATSRGLELEGTVGIGERWDVRAAYTYTDTEQEGGGDDGNELANVPTNAGSLWVNYGFTGTALDGLSLGAGLRYIGDRYGDNANEYEMDAVTLVDAGARYAFANGASAALNLTNLTDEVYVANCGSFGCYFGEGRTVMASLSYTW